MIFQYFKRMVDIPYLPNIQLTKEQTAWLKEAWRLLKDSGCNPVYRVLRLKTVGETGATFEPNSIDERLIKEKATQITLLGVLHVEQDSQILNDFDKIVHVIKKKLIEDSDLEEIYISQIASELNMDSKYAQIVFALASHYGSFWSSAGRSDSPGASFGYERIGINQPNTFDTYISFEGVSVMIEAYYRKQQEYDMRRERSEPKVKDGLLIDRLIKKQGESNQSKNEELFPLEIFNDTRGYIKKIALQASLCYRNEFYDASFVMIRKLVETLIIEAFERHEISSKIKASDGHYLFLSDLIGVFLSEKSWSISRNTKSALPRLKKFADLSAHNRRFLAKKTDIDKLDDLRVIIEEIIHMIDYPTWQILRIDEKNEKRLHEEVKEATLKKNTPARELEPRRRQDIETLKSIFDLFRIKRMDNLFKYGYSHIDVDVVKKITAFNEIVESRKFFLFDKGAEEQVVEFTTKLNQIEQLVKSDYYKPHGHKSTRYENNAIKNSKAPDRFDHAKRTIGQAKEAFTALLTYIRLNFDEISINDFDDYEVDA